MRVPKKNISSYVADVRASALNAPSSGGGYPVSPSQTTARAEPPDTLPGQEIPEENERGALIQFHVPSIRERDENVSRRRLIVSVFIFLIAATGIFGVRFIASRMELLRRAEVHFDAFETQVRNARGFGYDESSGNRSEERGKEAFLPPISNIEEFVSAIVPVLKASGKIYDSFQGLSLHTLALVERIEALEKQLIPFLVLKRGDELIQALGGIRDEVVALKAVSEEIPVLPGEPGGFPLIDSKSLFSLNVEMNRLSQFLDRLVTWLASEGERRVLVVFHNPAELRPGGGFIGSYADVSLRGGALHAIAVHDVNDADRLLETNIVPPKPLQALVTSWRAADANWFFDYADSARKTIALVESSNLYQKEKIVFDGAIGITPAVVMDLLSLTGPIELSGNRTIAAENVFTEIQKDVQIGQERRSSRPKRILEELTPLLLERIAELDAEKQRDIIRRGSIWVRGKDVLAYFKDETIQNFIEAYGAGGRTFPLSPNFVGDYLAVAVANIGGGKTDFVIRQTIRLESRVEEDGTVANHLRITRKHDGAASKFSWYRVRNQAYLKVFTPPGSRLGAVSGGIEKKITEPLNYAERGYLRDPDIESLEKTEKPSLTYPAIRTFVESGKNVFATWSRTDLGATSTLALDYRRRMGASVSDGQTYQFIFEKQSGATGEYQFEIHAPVGFVWRENGLPVFEYATSDPPGRLILDLTMEKI